MVRRPTRISLAAWLLCSLVTIVGCARSHSTAVSSPPPDPYADLAALGVAVHGADVVALGEPLHTVGNIDAYNARVVAYLHERFNFNVLAWEAGLWSCESDAATCPGRPWDDDVETRPLRKPNTPAGLIVTGFDIQFTGGARQSRERLRDTLIRLLGPQLDSLAREAGAVLERLPKEGRFREMTAEERETDRKVLDSVLAKVCAGQSPPSAERSLAIRAIENTLSLYDWHEAVHAETSTHIDWEHHTELNNVRDEQMARNVLWLLRERYPNQKIIIWAANMHIARNVSTIRDLRGADFANSLPRYRTMGSILHAGLGDKYVSVGTTAFGGSVGHSPSIPVSRVDDASPTNIEAGFATKTTPTFVRLSPDFSQPQRGRFLGLVDFEAPWSAVFDGAVMFPSVTPSTSETKP